MNHLDLPENRREHTYCMFHCWPVLLRRQQQVQSQSIQSMIFDQIQGERLCVAQSGIMYESVDFLWFALSSDTICTREVSKSADQIISYKPKLKLCHQLIQSLNVKHTTG